jgi:hypothetical protein
MKTKFNPNMGRSPGSDYGQKHSYINTIEPMPIFSELSPTPIRELSMATKKGNIRINPI